MNPTTCLGDTDCCIQQVTAPTLGVTCWIQQSVCILHSSRTGGASPPVQVEGKMHTDCCIQQVTTRVGAVTCWIQQSVSPKQLVGFTCVFNSEIDQFVRKSSVVWKIGAFQAFIETKDTAGNFAPQVFPDSDVHRIGILDIRIINLDRNDGNLLVR